MSGGQKRSSFALADVNNTYVFTKEVVVMARLAWIDWTALVLVIIGGVNWGLIGLFGFDLVAALFGFMTPLSRFVYVLVGIAAVYMAVMSTRFEKT